MRQLSLLEKTVVNKSYKLDDYILSTNNISAYRGVVLDEWSTHCKILYGKLFTGKTHLAHVWRFKNQAIMLDRIDTLRELDRNYVVEDIEKIPDEEELLHLYNLTKECRCKLLLTTSILPRFLPYKLADLMSRLLSVPILKLEENNDDLLRLILMKEFSVRQVKVSKVVLNYIINHVERSVQKIFDIINIIDSASIEEKRNITIPFIKRVLLTNDVR